MNKSNLEFIAAMIIFGSNGVLASFVPWYSYEIVLARTTIGALSMLLIILLTRQRLVFKQHLSEMKMLVFSGIFMGLNWMFLYEAYRHLGVGLAQILSSSGPALAMVLAPLIFKEQLRKHKLFGFAVVLVGMVFISSNDLSAGSLFGLACGFAATITYAGFIVCNRFAPSIQGSERVMWQLLIASVMVFGFVLYRGTGLPSSLSFSAAIAVLLLGVVNTGLAVNLMFSSLQKLPLQTVGIYAYLEPMSALIFSALLLGEQMSLIQYLGVALILGGTAFAELYRPRRARLAPSE
ncbi:DMT family transporter [Boudabousia marimammalium]|uniref:EamA domain-containing protein n=1 Tax=Boudabousia marimammalium TaxID=156892 RepID=A0A1Q5PLW4_9ACTO|nr:DMT family transporter [Boudabousia marimammalium]OKL48051.1 hypothetical protein BM477_06170 [Boudabousia marimammalium]